MEHNEKGEVTDHIVRAGKKKIPFCLSQKSLKRRPVKLISGKVPVIIDIFRNEKSKKSLEGKYREQPKNANDCNEHTIPTIENGILHGKLISTPKKFQKSPKKDMSPYKHQLKSPGGKYVCAFQKARKMEEGIVSELEPKV